MLNAYYTLILDLIKGMWRFRVVGLAVAWVLAIACWGFVLLIPNTYESRAMVSIDTDSVLGPLLDGIAVSTDVQSRVSIIAEALLSRENLQGMIEDSSLKDRATSEEDKENLVKLLRERILIDRTAAARSGENNIYEISFSDNEPLISYEIVNLLLKALVSNTVENNQGDAKNAQEFLVAQIDDYEKRLTEAEDRLSEFKRQNVGSMPDESGGYYANLQQAEDQLKTTVLKLSVARSRSNELERQLIGEEPVFGLAPQEVSQSFSSTTAGRELQKYLDTRQQLLLKYTELHPEIQSIDSVIEDLRGKHQQQLQVLSESGAANSPLKKNLVYQTMKIALNQADVEVRSLQTEYGVQKRKVDELRKQVDSLPAVEAELARLNRDYNINKTNYDDLVQRLETAKLSQKADNVDEAQQFKLIEAPQLPLEPSAPPRNIFLLGAFLISLLGALGIMFLLNQLKPVFISANSARKFTHVPVLAAVGISNYNHHQAVLVQQIVKAVLAIAGLVAILMVLIIFQHELVALIHSGKFKL